MGRYKLVFRNSVAGDLRALPKKDVTRILKKIESVADDPRGRGCQKLTDQEFYRVRQGDYRIVYEIKDDVLIVVVVKVGHRRDVYRGG